MADASTPPPQPSHPTTSSIKEKTLGVMNVPDTVNDARITQLFSTYGQLKKVILRPDHKGAIVEFENVADAGKAALALEGAEIIPGRKLEIGSVQELMREKAEHKDGKIVPPRLQKPTHVNRPIQQSGMGRGGAGRKRRGGLGFKAGARGLSGSSSVGELKGTDKGEGSGGKNESDSIEAGAGKPKSNADFKAMFLKQKP
jgi:squamous cell carcinoma antigen recognized by T-cells 3